jgi:hypothetical protein
MIPVEEIITTDRFLHAFPHDYYKTDCIYLGRDIIWRGKQHNMPKQNLDLIISGHSDYGIDDNIVEYFKPKVWYAINKLSPKINSIPLGITNDCDDSDIHKIYGNLQVMSNVMKEPKVDKNLVYMNFNINTYPVERQFVYDLFKSQPWVTIGNIVNTIEGRTQFLKDVRNHTFVLCPRGNGVDTHRLWETLYMGSIPIIKKHVAYEDFYDLPICLVDEWTDVTPEFLEKEYKRVLNNPINLEKLYMSYWINKINDSMLHIK